MLATYHQMFKMTTICSYASTTKAFSLWKLIKSITCSL